MIYHIIPSLPHLPKEVTSKNCTLLSFESGQDLSSPVGKFYRARLRVGSRGTGAVKEAQDHSCFYAACLEDHGIELLPSPSR